MMELTFCYDRKVPEIPNNLLLAIVIFNNFRYSATKYYGKLYVTKPILSSYIDMLYGVILPHLFVVVKS